MKISLVSTASQSDQHRSSQSSAGFPVSFAERKTGGALPQAPPSGYVSSPHVTITPTGEAGAARVYPHGGTEASIYIEQGFDYTLVD
jgi:hypothetical protein